jgi:lysozyme family protein
MTHFDAAVAYTLNNEGILSNDQHDRGGLTKFGITAPTLETYTRITGLLSRRAVDSLTRAEAVAIYRALFWRFDQIQNATVAIKLFDYSVNVGLSQATRFAQRSAVLLGVPCEVDGRFGPDTIAAVNQAVARRGFRPFTSALCMNAAKFYVGLVEADATQLDFIRGWLARCAANPAA